METGISYIGDVNLVKRVSSAYWVCRGCGLKYGRGIGHGKKAMSLSTFHEDRCDICLDIKDVTQFRDFGYAKQIYYAEGIKNAS